MGELPSPRGARRKGPLRKAPYLKKNHNRKTLSAPSSGPTTPMVRSGRSPLSQQPTAPTSTSAELRAELKALQIPAMHLLALGNASEHSLATKTRAPEDLVLKVLAKIARRVGGGRQWALDDEAYKELDVWDFPYLSPADREKAIANCRDAFHRLRLEKRAPEWRLLLSPEDREKADMNAAESAHESAAATATAAAAAAAAAATSATTKLAPGARSAVKPPSPPSSSVETYKRPTQKEPAKAAAAGKTASAKPSKQDPLARIINPKGKKKAPAGPAKPKGPVGRPPKNPAAAATRAAKSTTTTAAARQAATGGGANSKIKSAETVDDSDEEVEMEDVKLLSPPKQQLPVKKKSVSPQQRHKLPAKPPPPSSDLDADAVRLNPNQKRTPNPAASKSPAKKPRLSEPTPPSSFSSSSSSSSSSSNGGYTKAAASSTLRSLPSSREAYQRSCSNSPRKPSPLGSSPPISASDPDVGSTSSSPSFMTSNAGTSSTASQSPLDSLSGRGGGGGQKPRYTGAVLSLKRKAPDGLRAPASSVKRQLVSVPDGQTMELARLFKKRYERYARLYREAETTTDVYKKKEAIDRVIGLHRELERLKLQISNSAAH